MEFKKIILLTATTLSLIGCATTPDDAGISEDEINAQSLQAYTEVKSKSKISKNADWTALVQRVSQRIAAASGKNYQWEYVLIESPEVNAWCMPGGKIAVYTGILPVVKTEAALAAVLGHEVAHATLRHGMQSYARAKNENMTGLILGGAAVLGGELLCKTEQCKQFSRLGGVAAGLAVTFFNRKFSREDESSADQEGQLYMARAGYDPAESIKLWERMAAAKGGKSGPEFISTHPSDDRRQQNLSGWLPQARSEYDRAAKKYGVGETIR